MKILKNVVEVSGEGLESLLGQNVTIYTSGFIYAGRLVGVNQTCIKMSDACIVYDTGSHSSKTWQLAEKMPNDWYVQTSSIESFGIFK